MPKIWIVTRPTQVSTLIDILFSANPAELENQFKGGLSGSEIVYWSFKKSEAKEYAEMLLRIRDIEKIGS